VLKKDWSENWVYTHSATHTWDVFDRLAASPNARRDRPDADYPKG
jgi:hypothetical protein